MEKVVELKVTAMASEVLDPDINPGCWVHP